MKLGIIVVYMVREENEPLLDLHLNQIERYTSLPYTIYAGVHLLLPKFRKKLERNPKIKIGDCPDPHLTGAEEHSYYLEQLIQLAIADDVSHLITLHVDSFPVRSGWAEELIGRLESTSVLVTISRENYLIQYTACLCFHRDFYQKHRPNFFLSESDRSSPAYGQFSEKYPHHPGDSGVGFVFKAFLEGFNWSTLNRSNKGEDHSNFGNIGYNFASIYGDLVFHLEGAYRLSQSPLQKGLFIKLDFPSFLNRLKKIIKLVIPKEIIPKWLRGHLNSLNFGLIINPTYSYIRNELFQDPQGYLTYLRTGTRIDKSQD